MTIKAQALATLVINADGYSPTVTTGTSSDGSTTVTVTNKDGSTTTELVDGTARKDAADAATSATDYISPQSVSSADDGIKVFPKSEKDNPKNYININSSSTDIYKNGKKIAQYSQGIIINDDNGNKVFSAELMNGKYINEHVSNFYHKEISAGVTTTLSFDLIVAPSGDIEGTIPVSDNSNGGLLGIMNVYSFIEAPQELSIPSEYGTGSVLVNSISYTNRTVTISITNNTNIEIDFGISGEYADHMIWSYYMRDYGVATRCGGFWENDYTKAFAIGIGKDTNNKKNAFAVDWEGNAYVSGHDSPIGTRLTANKNNITIAAGIDKHQDGASLTLGKGTWIAMGRWGFGTRASGTTSSNRQASIVVNGTIWMSQRINTYGGNFGTVQCVAMLNLTEESNTVVCAGSCSQATSGTNYDSSILDVIRIA